MGAKGRWRTGDLTVVVRREPGSAGPLDFVLVHGIAVSSRYFERLSAELARYGTVYLVDLPGYGRAPKAGRDVSIADHADALAGFLIRSGLRNPVLVGHSMGTQVVSKALVDHPELSDRLVLMAPTMPPGERSLGRAGFLLFIDSFRNTMRADYVIMTDYLRCGIPYFFAQCKHLFGDHLEDRLARITAKTLVITSDKDRVVPFAYSQAVADGIADARLEVVHGPHVMMYRDPARIAQLIAAHGAGEQ